MTLTLRTAVAHNAPQVAAAKHDFQQNIMTADFSAPVLFAGVYEYDAAELGFEGGGRIRVYYPPEAIADKDFVQSVFYSVLSVGTHEKNTREENADPDGFIRKAVYDDKTYFGRKAWLLLIVHNRSIMSIQNTRHGVSSLG